MVILSFFAALAIFALIGIASAARSRGTKDDYYLASRDVSPMFAGLSAIATNNSGYMFIGLMGFTYAVGLSSLWLMAGWILGDFLISLVVHRRLREISGARREPTFAGLLARWNGTDYRRLRAVAALITLVLLGAYAAAQFNAGGKALQSLTGWPPDGGAALVAGVVALYCLAGGLRASIWTDVAQSLVMLAAMAVMLVAGIAAVGGPDAVLAGWRDVPGYLDAFPGNLLFPGIAGQGLFVIGWLFAGISVIGQPHIMVRFMALQDAGRLPVARAWYYGFFLIFYALASGVGLLSRLLLPELGELDPELALPTMAQAVLPPVLVGVVIAGIFAATMSTADSLVLACSSALTHDLLPRRVERTVELKTITLLVIALALGIALAGTQNVFVLVIFAWSGLASAFGPLLFVYARGHRPGEAQAVLMMGVGLSAAIAWRALDFQDMVYEGMPGMLAGWLTWYLSRRRLGAPVGDSAAKIRG